ncbi:hypothetical protein [Oribacterium sp.]
MNYLIARVNDHKEKYRKIIADNTVFYNLPSNLKNHHEYTPTYKLEDDEWYSVNNFSKKDFCIELIKDKFDTTSYKPLTKAEPCNVTYLCAFQDNTVYYFQRVFKHSVLERKKAVILGDEIAVKENPKQIILSDNADAIYVINEDTLYFRKLETISPIFVGIDVLYREATKKEVSDFLGQTFIHTGEGYGVEKVGKANRRRIAIAIENFNKLKKEQKTVVIKYTNDYYPQLNFDGNSFTIKSEDDMKYLLYGLEQLYYTTPATNEKRVANSVSRILVNGK